MRECRMRILPFLHTAQKEKEGRYFLPEQRKILIAGHSIHPAYIFFPCRLLQGGEHLFYQCRIIVGDEGFFLDRHFGTSPRGFSNFSNQPPDPLVNIIFHSRVKRPNRTYHLSFVRSEI